MQFVPLFLWFLSLLLLVLWILLLSLLLFLLFTLNITNLFFLNKHSILSDLTMGGRKGPGSRAPALHSRPADAPAPEACHPVRGQSWGPWSKRPSCHRSQRARIWIQIQRNAEYGRHFAYNYSVKHCNMWSSHLLLTKGFVFKSFYFSFARKKCMPLFVLVLIDSFSLSSNRCKDMQRTVANFSTCSITLPKSWQHCPTNWHSVTNWPNKILLSAQVFEAFVCRHGPSLQRSGDDPLQGAGGPPSRRWDAAALRAGVVKPNERERAMGMRWYICIQYI